LAVEHLPLLRKFESKNKSVNRTITQVPIPVLTRVTILCGKLFLYRIRAMKFRIILALIVAGFVVFCGWLVDKSGLFASTAGQMKRCTLLQQTVGKEGSWTENTKSPGNQRLEAADYITLHADNARPQPIMLGSLDPNSGFKFQLELSSKGAAIDKATFSEFDDRDPENPQPLVVLSGADGEVLPMANRELVLYLDGRQYRPLPMDQLHWQNFGVQKSSDGSQSARFEAVITAKETDQAVIKLTKTYKIRPGIYLVDFDLAVQNQWSSEIKMRFGLAGPGGIGREGARRDMRKVVAGFRRNQKDQITGTRIGIGKFDGDKTFEKKPLTDSGRFLWAAAVNKYFAAILVPVPEQGKDYCDWVKDKTACYYNPDGRKKTDDEDIGVHIKTKPAKLAASGRFNSTKGYNFQLYLGPKDKSLFDKNQQYRRLGFVQTIDFLACCCPASIIRPLAFGILTLMKWMYSFIGNYGVVIIILVFLIRIAIHPLTKRSQVSMSKMGELTPKIEEIKKKYANNKSELNKQMMSLYRKHGASPIMGMLPMMAQMPIWIALYSAIYTSIELRGAPFLPVWITDLSVPDALVRFSAITVPLVGWKIDSLNLLPILMGAAMFLQQKLTPTQATSSANPQVAQQQKIMMFMMPLFLPIVLYTAPSGLNLYIMASTFAGVIEQYVIRKHIREKKQAEKNGLVSATSKTGGKVKKKKPKPFFKKF